MRCVKALGERVAARDPDLQADEVRIGVAVKSRFSALDTAEICRVA